MRRDLFLLVGLVALASAAHGINMFDHPAPTLADDEGTYLQQAWAVIRVGRLTPYTYTYDHVPGGWIQLAAWLAAVGPLTFGSVTSTARVLILLMHVVAVGLLYVTARRLGVPRPGAAMACVFFAASPLALFYGREAILDNVMAFWLVVALAALVAVPRTGGAVLAGAALGVAALSKEPAVILIPAYAVLAHARAPAGARIPRVAAMVVPAVAIAALYPAYALANGDLWPRLAEGLRPNDPRAYAGSSLLDSVLWQLGRPGGSPLDPASEMRVALGDWLRRDALLVILGLASSVWNAYRRGRGRTWTMPIGLLGLVSFGFLVRGGVVYPFHIPLALPFLALNIGTAFGDLLPRVRRIRWPAARTTLAAALAVTTFWCASRALPALFLERPGDAGRAAVAWIRASVPSDALIIGRDDLWAELREPDAVGRSIREFHSHLRLAYDRDLRRRVLVDGWRSVRYVVVSPELVDGLMNATHDIELVQALSSARLVARWVSSTSDEALHPRQVLEIWEVDPSRADTRLVGCVPALSFVC